VKRFAEVAEFLELLERVKGPNLKGEYSAWCPAHNTHHGSLSIKEEDGKILVHCHADCPTEDICQALGLTTRSLFLKPEGEEAEESEEPQHIVAKYPYVNEEGTTLYWRLRYGPRKDFCYRRMDDDGNWIWNLDGVRRVPYRLPQLMDGSDFVVLAEGEKDTDRAIALGFTASSLKNWHPNFPKYFRDRIVAIIADADESGRKQAENVAVSLASVAKRIKVLELPNAKDLSEWADKGGTQDELMALISKAPWWTKSDRTEIAVDEDGEISITELAVKLRRAMKAPRIPTRWDVPGFIPRGGLVLLAGRRGEMKSYIQQCMAQAYTEGGKLFRLLHIEKRPFLYATREGSMSLFDDRFAELDFDFRKKENRGFILWGIWNEIKPPMLPDELYRHWAKERGGVMDFDGLRRFFRGDENSSEVIDPIAQELMSLTQNGTTVLAIQHRGKSPQTEVRGSSVFEDMCGVEYIVKAKRDGSRIVSVDLECVKNWYAEPMWLTLKPSWEKGRFRFIASGNKAGQERWEQDVEMVLKKFSYDTYSLRKEVMHSLKGELGLDRIGDILRSQEGITLKRKGSGLGAAIAYRRIKNPNPV